MSFRSSAIHNQLFFHPLIYSASFWISSSKLIHLFVLCAKWPLWKNQKHWQNTQLDLNSDIGMSFQPSSVRKRHLFLDWNIFRCCNYLKLFHTERAYGELSCLAWFYLPGKLHNFSKCKYWFAVLGWFVSLFEFGFLWVYRKKSKVSHNRKYFLFLSFVAYYI